MNALNVVYRAPVDPTSPGMQFISENPYPRGTINSLSDLSAPDGPHVGHMSLAIWVIHLQILYLPKIWWRYDMETLPHYEPLCEGIVVIGRFASQRTMIQNRGGDASLLIALITSWADWLPSWQPIWDDMTPMLPLCMATILLCFLGENMYNEYLVESCDVFAYIRLGCLAVTRTIMGLPGCQWNNP